MAARARFEQGWVGEGLQQLKCSFTGAVGSPMGHTWCRTGGCLQLGGWSCGRGLEWIVIRCLQMSGGPRDVVSRQTWAAYL